MIIVWLSLMLINWIDEISPLVLLINLLETSSTNNIFFDSLIVLNIEKFIYNWNKYFLEKYFPLGINKNFQRSFQLIIADKYQEIFVDKKKLNNLIYHQNHPDEYKFRRWNWLHCFSQQRFVLLCNWLFFVIVLVHFCEISY